MAATVCRLRPTITREPGLGTPEEKAVVVAITVCHPGKGPERFGMIGETQFGFNLFTNTQDSRNFSLESVVGPPSTYAGCAHNADRAFMRDFHQSVKTSDWDDTGNGFNIGLHVTNRPAIADVAMGCH
jgi:hypothetical protein